MAQRAHSAEEWLGNPVKHRHPGRICKYPGCRETLSIYNLHEMCFRHQRLWTAMEDMIGSNRDRRRAVKACLMCMGGGRFKKLETIARKFRTTIPRLKELKKQGAGIIRRLERKINEDHRGNL